MTANEAERITAALQELDRADRMHQRNHPEAVAESVQIARGMLAELLQAAGINLPD